MESIALHLLIAQLFVTFGAEKIGEGMIGYTADDVFESDQGMLTSTIYQLEVVYEIHFLIHQISQLLHLLRDRMAKMDDIVGHLFTIGFDTRVAICKPSAFRASTSSSVSTLFDVSGFITVLKETLPLAF